MTLERRGMGRRISEKEGAEGMEVENRDASEFFRTRGAVLSGQVHARDEGLTRRPLPRSTSVFAVVSLVNGYSKLEY